MLSRSARVPWTGSHSRRLGRWLWGPPSSRHRHKWGWCSCSDRLAGVERPALQDELAVLEAVAGEQEAELIGSVDATPVGAQAQDQLEDQVEGVLAYSQPLAGVGAQADAGEDGLDRVAGAEVHPVLLWEVVEGDEVLPVPLQEAAAGA